VNIIQVFALLVLALVVEALWDSLKMTWQKGKFSPDRVGALVLGIVLAVGADVDFFELVGVPISWPYVGPILTGVILSRGANFVHDLLASVEGLKGRTRETRGRG